MIHWAHKEKVLCLFVWGATSIHDKLGQRIAGPCNLMQPVTNSSTSILPLPSESIIWRAQGRCWGIPIDLHKFLKVLYILRSFWMIFWGMLMYIMYANVLWLLLGFDVKNVGKFKQKFSIQDWNQHNDANMCQYVRRAASSFQWNPILHAFNIVQHFLCSFLSSFLQQCLEKCHHIFGVNAHGFEEARQP